MNESIKFLYKMVLVNNYNLVEISENAEEAIAQTETAAYPAIIQLGNRFFSWEAGHYIGFWSRWRR